MSDFDLGPSTETIEHAMERIYGRDPWWVRAVEYVRGLWLRMWS